jgi:PKHD-type hydroxylase
MNLKWSYWVYNKAVAPEICDKIIDLLVKSKKNYGTIGHIKETKSKKDKNDLFEFRKSHVAFRKDPFLYRIIHPFVNDANQKAGWNFQWDTSEECQLTKYGKGQYYNWHMDAWPEPYKEGVYKGKIRKLSSVLVLNNASEYEGGELQFSYDLNYEKTQVESPEFMKNKGSIVVFPAFVWHRVKHVIKGNRFSLTNWHLGNPYV